ncbi:unnamed protein product [Camellia sinensis]
MVIINPGNPTGQCLSEANLKEILRFCYQENLVLLGDEVYQQNIYQDERPFISVRKTVDEIYKVASISLSPNVPRQIFLALMVNPPKPGDISYNRFVRESKGILESLRKRARIMTNGFNSCRNVVCAMYSFPQIRLPPKAIEAAKKAGKVPDVFYCLKLLEATGISTVPGSGFGQKEGVFHLRTTILPAEEDMPAIMASFKKFNDEFMDQYEDYRGYSRMVMVEYWSSKDAMKIASRNSKNRELRGLVHRTGRTPFADVRHKMMTDGESTNKMSVFMKTRMITDPDVKLFLDEYNEQLSMIDEPLRTEEVQDKIFHNLVGKDGHGYCKTYGIGVPRSAVYKKDVSPSQASSSSTVEEITQQVRQTVTEEIEQRLTVEIEQRVTEKLKAEFEQVRAWMDFIRSQGGLSGIQLPNAFSGRQQVRKSVGDHDSQDDELLGSPVQ